MMLFIATYVDYGETCDGKARVLDVYKTEDEAKNAVRADIEYWADNHANQNIEVDFDKMSAKYSDVEKGCEWSINEVEVQI